MKIQFPDGNDIPAIGSARPAAKLSYNDLAVFLDGDVTNDDPSNMLDLKYFEEHYDFEQFIEDSRDRTHLMHVIRRLERMLEVAHERFSDGANLLRDFRPADPF